MGQIVFVVWRESVEALLVVGILNAWLSHQGQTPDAARGKRFLWAGVSAGVVLAVALAAALLFFGEIFSDDGQEPFQAFMVLAAAALIVQMVVWMRRHGRSLKRELEEGAARSMAEANWWGLFVLALLAVAREGSETVVFIYGILAGGHIDTGSSVGAAALGGILAVATYWLLQLGGRYVSWRLFFRVTEIMLLLLAASLVMSGIDHLVSLGIVPVLSRPLWDTSALLEDGGVLGGFVSGLTGYRARPDLTSLITYAAYWLLVILLLPRSAPKTAA
ncbi:MAG: FTR1 family iron permease [Alphaproteobacteria bacterium]